MVALWEIPQHEQQSIEDIKTEENVDSNADSNVDDVSNIGSLNKNPKSAQKEADKIIDWLPSSVDKLSPEQQKQFIGSVESLIFNIPELADILPNNIPKTWTEQLHQYTTLESKKSQLPPKIQTAFEKAKKDAIQDITAHVSDMWLMH